MIDHPARMIPPSQIAPQDALNRARSLAASIMGRSGMLAFLHTHKDAKRQPAPQDDRPGGQVGPRVGRGRSVGAVPLDPGVEVVDALENIHPVGMSVSVTLRSRVPEARTLGVLFLAGPPRELVVLEVDPVGELVVLSVPSALAE